MDLKIADRGMMARAKELYTTSRTPADMVNACRALGMEAVYLKHSHAVGIALTARSGEGIRYAHFPWPRGARAVSIDE